MQPRMSEAIFQGVLSQVFAKPTAAGTATQRQQGARGAAGAPHGGSQGYVGAAVPQAQTAAQRPTTRSAGTNGALGGQRAPSASGGPNTGGLSGMLPWLMAIPLLLKFLGGGK